ncbi:hypothetical protein [Thalassotalea atypica]|uniref:hypothetical protein n=1 Tax=Thalassotalea atypica TaxID=2054316 RepID=UPI0025736B9B|nr:hypothetical protein [Thalassotalea atypica]
MPFSQFLSTTLIILSLTGCAVVPSVNKEYDKQCNIVKKNIELSIEQVDAFDQLHCSSNHECKADFLGQVAGAALIFPVSAVISGSIAVVGNTMYWLTELGECSPKVEENHDNSDEKKPKQNT